MISFLVNYRIIVFVDKLCPGFLHSYLADPLQLKLLMSLFQSNTKCHKVQFLGHPFSLYMSTTSIDYLATQDLISVVNCARKEMLKL